MQQIGIEAAASLPGVTALFRRHLLLRDWPLHRYHAPLPRRPTPRRQRTLQ